MQREESGKLIDSLKDRDLKVEKQNRELKTQIAELRDVVNAWSTHTLFQRVLFDLEVYRRTQELDARFIERLLKAKVSE